MNLSSPESATRQKQLKEIAESYFDALRKKQFQMIPYHEDASLRAPFTARGVDVPLQGKGAIYEGWWVPLEPALDGVTINILGHYYHEDLKGIITEAEITLKAPAVTLRVADRFTVNEEGKIVEQENHVDPRAVTG
jgi:hypothetical protein